MEDENNMDEEIFVIANKNDKELTVQCSLLSDNMKINKFIQISVQRKFIVKFKSQLKALSWHQLIHFSNTK